ncbi:MAG: hypothetical protein ACI4F3_10590, partial [Enterocloster sp.]
WDFSICHNNFPAKTVKVRPEKPDGMHREGRPDRPDGEKGGGAGRPDNNAAAADVEVSADFAVTEGGNYFSYVGPEEK